MALVKYKNSPLHTNKHRFLYLRLSAFICGLNPFHSINQRLKLICNIKRRRFVNSISAFICVHPRLKNIQDNFYYQHLSAPICDLNTFSSINLR